MEKEFLIATEKNYQGTLIAIYKLMNKGVNNFTSEELEQLRIMAIAAEKYEDEMLHLKPKLGSPD